MQSEPDESPPRRKTRVFTEEVKQRQVSHWDWDYLTRDELERLQEEANARREGEATSE